ncbi:MAG: pyridoxamine 5'-phosphate oxidase family protein [Thermomicrobium sp.]|nr:pyridoxamine 5'-phosphate oxidase family protein [Thermomicrobium sp.]
MHDRLAGSESLRGRVRRVERRMPDEEARRWLQAQKVVHVATRDHEGWPDVIPLVFVSPSGKRLYFHTGAQGGHFLSNVRADPRVCVEAAVIGPLHPGKPYACNSALVYTSVVAFGRLRIVDDEATKSWFFDRLMEKYSDLGLFEPGYPLLDRIVLYEMTIELLTGKRSERLRP